MGGAGGSGGLDSPVTCPLTFEDWGAWLAAEETCWVWLVVTEVLEEALRTLAAA